MPLVRILLQTNDCRYGGRAVALRGPAGGEMKLTYSIFVSPWSSAKANPIGNYHYLPCQYDLSWILQSRNRAAIETPERRPATIGVCPPSTAIKSNFYDDVVASYKRFDSSPAPLVREDSADAPSAPDLHGLLHDADEKFLVKMPESRLPLDHTKKDYTRTEKNKQVIELMVKSGYGSEDSDHSDIVTPLFQTLCHNEIQEPTCDYTQILPEKFHGSTCRSHAGRALRKLHESHMFHSWTKPDRLSKQILNLIYQTGGQKNNPFRAHDPILTGKEYEKLRRYAHTFWQSSRVLTDGTLDSRSAERWWLTVAAMPHTLTLLPIIADPAHAWFHMQEWLDPLVLLGIRFGASDAVRTALERARENPAWHPLPGDSLGDLSYEQVGAAMLPLLSICLTDEREMSDEPLQSLDDLLGRAGTPPTDGDIQVAAQLLSTLSPISDFIQRSKLVIGWRALSDRHRPLIDIVRNDIAGEPIKIIDYWWGKVT